MQPSLLNIQSHKIKLFLMRSKQQPKPSDRSFSLQNRSASDKAMLKRTTLVQQKLKREINNKFNKNDRRDEVNQSTVVSRRKSSGSILFNNPLTKSSYSMNDTIIHKSAMKEVVSPMKKAVKSMMGTRQKVNSSYRQRYNSSIDSPFFQTRAQGIENGPTTPRLKQSFSAKETISRKSSVDKVFKSQIEARQNKFKLLFRQKESNYKTPSERKINRINTKIQSLKDKKEHLKSLMPRQKPKIVQPKVKPRGQIVKKQKIMTLTLNLIKYIELYFNMYQHNNIVGGHFKNIEGYSPKIRNILMMDNNRAKRITNVEQITNLFWSYKSQSERPQFFGQEDLTLYNTLNGYYLKMQKKYVQTLNKFNYYESKKRKQEKQAFRKTYDKFQKKMGKHEPINKINKFIEQRLRHDQSHRQEVMDNLEKRGVNFNLIQRSKQLILRQKQLAMKHSIKSLRK